MEKKYKCPACGGDGIETCYNPDHGFLRGMNMAGQMSANESACPCCGHNQDHKTGNKCYECKGTGVVTEAEAEFIADEYGLDDELEEIKP